MFTGGLVSGPIGLALVKFRQSFKHLAFGAWKTRASVFIGVVRIHVTVVAIGSGFRARISVSSGVTWYAIVGETVPTSGVLGKGWKVLVRHAVRTPFYLGFRDWVEHVRGSAFEFGHRIKKRSKNVPVKMIRGAVGRKKRVSRSFVRAARRLRKGKGAGIVVGNMVIFGRRR